MYNINVVGDCRELLKISQRRKIFQSERFRTKIALDIYTYVCMSKFSTTRQVKSENRNPMADETLDDTTSTGNDKGTILSGIIYSCITPTAQCREHDTICVLKLVLLWLLCSV